MPAFVWGSASPGREVLLTLDGAPVATVRTNVLGRWKIDLPAQPPGGPHRIALHADRREVCSRRVWFGEVWLASGQSNMAWSLADSSDSEEILGWPNRHIHRLRIPGSLAPVPEGEWFPGNPRWEAGADGDLASFSAVAMHFAEIVQMRTQREVGVICSAYGGSAIEAWLPPRAFSDNPGLAHLATALEDAKSLGQSESSWQAEVDRFREWFFARMAWHKTREGPEPVRPPLHPGNPLCQSSACLLYRAMLRPLIPYTCRGVLWYQGESNVDDPVGYEDLFRRLISAWREDWQAPQWPFYFVELPEFDGPGDWDGLRAVQARIRDTVPFTGMAMGFDCGDKDDIHPRCKSRIGRRLADLALENLPIYRSSAVMSPEAVPLRPIGIESVTR